MDSAQESTKQPSGDTVPPDSTHTASDLREETRPPPARRPVVKMAIDESVLGYPGDKPAYNSGVREMAGIVVKLLEDAGVSCCMVAEPALIYYGTGRVMTQWILCVPTELLETASQLMRNQVDILEPFRRSSLTSVNGLEHLFPRFKFIGISLFFVLTSSQAVHVPCTPESIEYSHNRIPYPKLPVYAQSLLETLNQVDLDDLVDGMNPTLEWGEENLDLDRSADAEWGRWCADFLNNGEKADDGDIPMWCFDPPTLRDIWKSTVSAEAKKNRQSWKYMPHMETRFRKYGQKDPRLRTRGYC
ncbi:hypothetical protein PRK78_005574 [Emydomyces testavorans]|uniref:Uncharacterized protein n=1 Tax=Emydomyces testavorans TaxID=2070801 RepID=A0AAF0DJW6_9EURO|nr:hypothetical protein PRK78_005574 [Emydomyces testavorans]